MRDVNGTIDWYKEHEVYPGELPFDPDGMCLAICRTARDIGPVYPSAVSAQEATPQSYRVHEVAKLKRGMVLYYDDRYDSNPYGHIVTMVGRVKDADPNSLGDILVRTNSVVANRVVVVRGDYFQRHWGDEFQFGATWLNGQKLIMGKSSKPNPPKNKKPLGADPKNLKGAITNLEKAVKFHRSKGHTRLVNALERDIQAVKQTIDKFS